MKLTSARSLPSQHHASPALHCAAMQDPTCSYRLPGRDSKGCKIRSLHIHPISLIWPGQCCVALSIFWPAGGGVACRRPGLQPAEAMSYGISWPAQCHAFPQPGFSHFARLTCYQWHAGKTYSFEVKPGPAGYRQFTEAIRQAFHLPEDSELNITFTCDEPSTGEL